MNEPITNIREFCDKRNSGECCQVSEQLYDYFLNVLPPVYMGKVVTLPDGRTIRASFGFAEGYERVTAFWHDANGNYFAQQTKQMNPYG